MKRPTPKATSFKRATPETRFQIDYGWWDEEGLDMKTYLYSRLPAGEEVSMDADFDEVDLVDPQTGEVKRVDGFEYVLQTQIGQMTNDYAARVPLAEAIFYALLANANQPLTAIALAEKVGRSPDVVIKTVAGPTVYLGIRPIYE